MRWICVFKNIEKISEIVPDQTSRLLKIGDRKLCLINIKGNLRVVDDKCPHQGASLNKGRVNYLGDIICPLHEYRFDSKTGQETTNRCADVKVYHTKLENGAFYVLLD